jgi:ATP-binding cassette subfamily F protein 3
VVVVSHDRHMLEMTADRLVLVDEGTAREFDGTLDDYIRLVLTGDSKPAASKRDKKEDKRLAAAAREADKLARQKLRDSEAEAARLTAQRDALDKAMFDPKAADPQLAKLAMSDLMKRRAEIQAKVEAAEARWLAASAVLEEAA